VTPADDHTASGTLCAVTDGRAGSGAGTYDADFLVVAMGADYDMDATPGLEAGGHGGW